MNNVYPLIIIFGWLSIVLSSSLFCKNFFPNKKELGRKIVHIGSGPIIPLVWSLNLSSYIVISVACLITVGLFVNHKLHLIPSIEDVERKSFGTIAYGISITLLIMIFWSNNPSAIFAGVLVMAFGDGFAGLIGSNIQSPSWTVLGQRKSLLGTLTMGVIGAIVLFTINQSMGLYVTPINIILITSLAVLFEQISPFGIDNITVPIGVGVVWNWCC